MAEKYHKEKHLEKKIDSKDSKSEKKPEGRKLSREEELSYHQGALQALAAEHNELVRMIKTVESIMKAHMERMQQMGIKFQHAEKQ
jgi:hypothetical protein